MNRNLQFNAGKSILVVEDEPRMRRSLASLLHRLDYHTRIARNALEAQALSEQCDSDVAIIDIELPGLRGDEWAYFLKQVCPTTRIIFVSNRPGLAGMDRFGPDVQFLRKPIDIIDLIAAIEAPAGWAHAKA